MTFENEEYTQFLCIIFYFYLIQGLPYGLQSKFFPIFMRSKGFSLSRLSMMKLLYLPLLMKAFYAPIIDIFLSKRKWLQISILLLFLNCIFFSFIEKLSLTPLMISILVMNVLCSMQDVALDALTLSVIHKIHVNKANVAQVVGYKIGALIGGGILLTLSQFFKWSILFLFLASFYAFGIFLTVTAKEFSDDYKDIKRTESEENQSDVQQNMSLLTYLKIIKESIKDTSTYVTIFYLLLYKMGEQGATNMLPLFLIDRKVQIASIGFWIGIVGQIISVAGSAYAVIFVSSKRSTYSAIKLLCLVIAPLVTSLVVIVSPDFYNRFPNAIFILSVTIINVIYLVSGILTSATFTLMMQCSQTRPLHLRATHYTIIATIEVIGKLLFTSIIGVYTDHYGYRASYILFAILSWLIYVFMIISSQSFEYSSFDLTMKPKQSFVTNLDAMES